MIKSCLTLICGLFVFSSFAQKPLTLSGTITDEKSGETLIGASIVLLENKGSGTLSNGYGFYSITAPSAEYTLVVSFSGYISEIRHIRLDKDLHLSITLKTGADSLQEVFVTARRRDNITQTFPGVQKLSMDEIKNIPVLFGEKDILKTIQLLPGIKSLGDGTPGFFVRGGGADQNLILLDEATVYNASHLLGFFSTFNSDAIKDVTLYKGDMPAQYGGRLSSLLDIKMNDGNNKEFHVGGGIGLISSRLNVEGPLVKNKGSFEVSARRTYADIFLKLSKDTLTNQSSLYFYDLNAKANYQFDDKNRIFLSGYFGKDVLGFSNQFGIKWGNTTGTLRFNHIFNSKLFSNTSVILSNYNYNISVNQNSNSVTDVSKIQDFSINEDMQYFVNTKNKINFGFDFTHHTFSPGVFNTSESSNFNSVNLPKKYALDGAIYISDEWSPSSRIKFNAGLRLSDFSVIGPGTFYNYDINGDIIDSASYSAGQTVKSYINLQPRLAVTYQLDDISSIKASYSNNVQNVHLLSNSTGGNPTDLWIPSSNNVKPEIADQLSMGYYRNIHGNQYELSAEVYYKNMQNQIDYKNGAVLLANINVESQLTYGKGRAYGVELFAKKKYGLLTGWISYTLSRTERKFTQINNDSWYPATQDQTNNISVVVIYKLSKKWTLSSDFVYNTGNAVTWPSGKYQVGTNVGFFYSERNGYRMPAYNRLDLGATLQGKKTKKFESSWTFMVYNTYGRENPYFVQFQTDPGNPEKTQAVQYSLFRWVPSITYNFKF
jgi:TonB dependent receptor/CarboxypepD_reg-like domain/TonB-dependent Receptor Plug Domain